jgi:hypothetical protein
LNGSTRWKPEDEPLSLSASLDAFLMNLPAVPGVCVDISQSKAFRWLDYSRHEQTENCESF